MHFNININEILKLSLTQASYAYFIRCMDLNFNFNDDKQYNYEFKKFIDLERLHMDEENLVNMRIFVKLKFLSLTLLNPDRTFLGEIFYHNAQINYVDKGNKEINISANKFFILDKPERGTKQVIIAPKNSKNIINLSDLMGKKGKNNIYNMEILMMQNGDKSIVLNVDKVKVFIKLYPFRKILDFFTQAMPDYDYSIDKPNGYYKRNGELESKDPGSKLTFIINLNKSLYLLTDDPTAEKVIV